METPSEKEIARAGPNPEGSGLFERSAASTTDFTPDPQGKIAVFLGYVFTRDRFQKDPVRKSNRIGLLFTRDRFGAGPERIQNWTYSSAGPILGPFGSVPDRLCQKPIQSSSVRNGSGPVPCKRNLDSHNRLTHKENQS